MEVNDFDFELPEELIAQTPYEKRDEAKLLLVNKESKEVSDKIFRDILDYINPGDCLVINDTKVLPARIYGKKSTGANVEVLLLKETEKDVWEAMVRPGNKLKECSVVYFGDLNQSLEELSNNYLIKVTILGILEDGLRKIRLEYNGILNEILDQIGLMPLPPYITEELKERDAYQTVYAKYLGSAAAPTAGLHFTEDLLKKIEEKGVKIAKVTLHVGLGTFRPVKVDKIENHIMHSEEYIITEEAKNIINNTKKQGGRIIAVGTTSCRTLESATDENGLLKAEHKATSIFIFPGYKFKMVDALITNFHLPKSTLIMLVSALAGKENILNAYNYAVRNKYKFFSFGDAMFIY